MMGQSFDRQAFCIRLSLIRGERSQREFADALGVIPQSVSRYERGVQLPGTLFLNALHSRESINLNWLFTGKGQRKQR